MVSFVGMKVKHDAKVFQLAVEVGLSVVTYEERSEIFPATMISRTMH